MADNNRKPEQQQADPARPAPGQQQKQAQPKPEEAGHNPGGQADKSDRKDQTGQVKPDGGHRTDR